MAEPTGGGVLPGPNFATLVERRLPIGADVATGGGVHFRVWAPRPLQVEVVLEEGPGAGKCVPLTRENGAHFSAFVQEAGAGTSYRFLVDGKGPYPDPASRSQPRGVHGPSRVIDPRAYVWKDMSWSGTSRKQQIIYEMHVGTFTPDGTWAAASPHLTHLAELGITVIEMMPIADFAGRFGWGYDGVALFAPTRLYGEPDDLRRFIDHAHAIGLGVILDVVYNHFGPDGSYHGIYSDSYITERHWNEWGDAINFDGPGSDGVREFFLANARYWIDEFHFDGLRIDATQSFRDDSPEHILTAIARVAREAANGRKTFVTGESEPQRAGLARAVDDGGLGLDALWNDDFHHAAFVAATGRNEAYFSDYTGAPQELISAVRHGFLFQGQHYSWQGKRRGRPAWDLASEAFIHFLQNHDQVANSATGRRLHEITSPGRYRTLTALLMLGPQTPLLFQGQEFAASTPFLYFADHEPDLARRVAEGRAKFLSQFPSIAQPGTRAILAEPEDPATFEASRLDHGERETNADIWALHHDLIRLRREDGAFRGPAEIDGAVLAPHAFVLRWFADADRDHRLLVVNLGVRLRLVPSPEPLLAPPEGAAWETLWSSEDPRYGGDGSPPLETDEGWMLPAESAVVLRPVLRNRT